MPIVTASDQLIKTSSFAIFNVHVPAIPDDAFDQGGPTGVITRNDDLLQLAYTVRTFGGRTFVAIDFPPQHIAEDTGAPVHGYAAPGSWPPRPGMFRRDLTIKVSKIVDWWGALAWTKGTRLVFVLPAGASPPDAKAPPEHWLDWSTWQLCLGPKAASTAQNGIVLNSNLGTSLAKPPARSDETGSCVAMPFGVVLGLTDDCALAHRDRPFTANGRTELWHTRIVPRDQSPPSARALWSLWSALQLEPNDPPVPDPPTTRPFPPIGTTFYRGDQGVPARDYNNLGFNGSGDLLPGGDGVIEWYRQPGTALEGQLQADLIHATTGLVASEQVPPDPIVLQNAVLSPMGASLRAALTVPRGRFRSPSTGLRSWGHAHDYGRDSASVSVDAETLWPFGHRLLLTAQSLRAVGNDGQAALTSGETVEFIDTERSYTPIAFRQPFKSLSIAHKHSSALHRIGDRYYTDLNGKSEYRIQLVGIDIEGREVHFSWPLLTTTPAEQIPAVDLAQQFLAFTDGPNGSFATDTITIGASGGFEVSRAEIRHPAIATFANQPGPFTILPPVVGIAEFAQIAAPLIDGTGNTAQFGGLFAPKVQPTALAKDVGAFDAIVDPANPFAAMGESMLFGCLPLKSLRPTPPTPSITSTRSDRQATTRMHWECKQSALGPGAVSLATGPILLEITATRPLEAGAPPPDWQSICKVEQPTLTLFGLAQASFNQISFTSGAARKTSVSADFKSVTFLGELGFVTGLIQSLPTTLFADAPRVDVSAAAVTVDCPIALPSLGLGVFALSNIAIDTRLTLPFVALDPNAGALSFAFDFSTPQNPFTVSVALLAGSGYFGIVLSPHDFSVDGAIGFGGNFQINFITVSGQVMVEGGIRLQRPAGGQVEVGGFFHAHGSVSMLAIASVSLDVMLLLSYDISNGAFTGSAQVTLRVELLFFSKSVSFTFSKTFGGTPGANTQAMLGADAVSPAQRGGGPPPRRIVEQPMRLAQALSRTQWQQYCGAFEAV